MVKNILFPLMLFLAVMVACSDDNAYPTIIDEMPDLPEGYTYIPDNNFEQALMDLGYDKTDTIQDDMVLTSEIENIKELHIDSLGIQKLTGIQDFKSLEILYCDWNELTKLDLSNNHALVKLDCQSNKIGRLILKNCPMLTYVICEMNEIPGIDLTDNINLEALYCSNNKISALDVSQNKMLQTLQCYGNQISKLYLNNPSLKDLRCSENRLRTLDLTNCDSIVVVDCFLNQLDTILFGEKNNIRTLSAGYNNLESIDLSGCSRLSWVDLKINLLKTINIRNGNNHGVGTFFVIKNPLLKCIQVDNAAWSIANWTDIDPWASFSEDCGY